MREIENKIESIRMTKDDEPSSMNTIEEALKALRNNELIVVIDDPDRENEGDLICNGENISTENLNFMASHGKGLICTPLSEAYAKKLKLYQMVENNTDNHETAFTVSVDHVDTTTGISAEERAYTIRKMCEEDCQPEELRRPGHVFPLLAKEHGVLERNGHTEATVDLMRLAGLKEVGVCCEIMREDGTMMRTKELKAFAREHGLVLISIKDLQDYRKRFDTLIEHQADASMPTQHGTFRIHGYVNKISKEHHVALVKGDIGDGEDVLVRVHSECLTGDAFGSKRCDCGDQLSRAMEMIEEEGRGVVLYMRQEGRGIGLINKLKAYELQDQGMDTLDANLALGFPGDAREYYIGAQILQDLGIKTMRLLTNNPDKVYQLEDFGMEILERVPIEIQATKEDVFYLQTKKDRMGHIIHSSNLES